MISGTHVRMARAGLKMTVPELAAAAGLNADAVTRIELGLGGRFADLVAVRRALEAFGADFLGDDAQSIGVRVPRSGSEITEPAMLRPEELNSSNDD